MTRATTRKLRRTATARDELDMAVALELGDRYQVERRERCGPLSCVYRARDVAAGQVVALKVLPHAWRQERASEGFEAAMAAWATLDHAHIIPVRGFGRTSQLLWYAMPHIDGRSLDDVLRNGGPLEPRTCLRLVEQLAAALHYAHGRGVTHGNVKPANVMVASAGLALLSDFALARALEAGVPHDAAASRSRRARGAHPGPQPGSAGSVCHGPRSRRGARRGSGTGAGISVATGGTARAAAGRPPGVVGRRVRAGGATRADPAAARAWRSTGDRARGGRADRLPARVAAARGRDHRRRPPAAGGSGAAAGHRCCGGGAARATPASAACHAHRSPAGATTPGRCGRGAPVRRGDALG